MQRHISHTIEIDATPDEVWGILADTESYPEWNPFIETLEGDLTSGAHLRTRISAPGGSTMTFKPRVLVAAPGSELRWLGRLLVRGLFDGEHAFVLESLPGGRTRFTQSETFSGVLVRALGGTLAKTEEGFRQMNEALRERVEKSRPASVGGSLAA
jgi:hypothetical protein